MSLTLITPPGVEPVSLDEARIHCRADAGLGEDALIQAYISAAREAAENELGRVLIDQTWEQRLDAFPDAEIRLDVCRASSIVSVRYLDASGTLQTLAPTAYSLDSNTEPGWLFPAAGTTWPETADAINAVRIQFVAGFGPAATDVPANIRAWILTTVGTLYAQRESLDLNGRAVDLPARFVDRLLDRYRFFA